MLMISVYSLSLRAEYHWAGLLKMLRGAYGTAEISKHVLEFSVHYLNYVSRWRAPKHLQIGTSLPSPCCLHLPLAVKAYIIP